MVCARSPATKQIDRPLLITKDGVESVVPRETWRGQFHAGTSPTTGARRDCPVGTQTNCLQIAWPGMQTNAAHSWGGEQPDIRVWYGGLVDGMRDASGQMYMRNRYYDPATGQFTQTDPIGLAGGLNAYGFAAGDPVTYSDPYGLCKKKNGEMARDEECPPEIVKVTTTTGGSNQFPSSVTVTTEYAPLSQEQVDYVIDEKRTKERTNDTFVAALVSGVAARFGLGTPSSVAVGVGIGVMGSESEWQYMPHVGDQITTSVTAGYGSSATAESFAVRRADGSTLRLTGNPWKP